MLVHSPFNCTTTISLSALHLALHHGAQALWCPSSSMRGVGRGWGNQKGGPAKWGAQPVHNENKPPYTAGLMCAIH